MMIKFEGKVKFVVYGYYRLGKWTKGNPSWWIKANK